MSCKRLTFQTSSGAWDWCNAKNLKSIETKYHPVKCWKCKMWHIEEII